MGGPARAAAAARPQFRICRGDAADRDRDRLGQHRRGVALAARVQRALGAMRGRADRERVFPAGAAAALGSGGELHQHLVEAVGRLELDPVPGARHHGEARIRLDPAQDARALLDMRVGGRVPLAPDPVEPRLDLAAAPRPARPSGKTAGCASGRARGWFFAATAPARRSCPGRRSSAGSGCSGGWRIPPPRWRRAAPVRAGSASARARARSSRPR